MSRLFTACGRFALILVVGLATRQGHTAPSAMSDAAAGAHESAPTDGAAADHGESAEDSHGHVPHFEDINWSDGLLGESAEAEPSLLYRRPGTPPPLLATLLNSAVLFGLLFYFGRRAVAEALRRRKEAITQGMQEAARVQEQASGRLDEFEKKLAAIDEQLAELRSEIRRSGELERDRVLAEARTKRDRMEHEARRLIEQELEAAREELTRRAVLRAMASARQILAQQAGPDDQNRLAEQYLTHIAAPRDVSGAIS